MTRGVQIVIGAYGYRHQLERARRFLARVERLRDDLGLELENLDDDEFQDMMWSFFQHCWHVKDWIRHDPKMPPEKAKAAIDMAHSSGALMICRDLCNGTKHLLLSDPRSGTGARHRHVDIKIAPSEGRFKIDYEVDDGHGGLLSGVQLARACIAEWERILGAQGLATAR